MNSRTDQELLREYAVEGSEGSFSEVVRRYLDLVFSAALRLVGNAQLAEDVSQKVFLALAKNASQLAGRSVLSGWLHCTTRNLSANAVRYEVRLHAREREAATMNELLAGNEEEAWEAIAPHLDTALGELSEGERDAVLLRYFQGLTTPEMARVLGISVEAAQKRANRAIERLRELFAKRGIAISGAAVGAIVSANAVQAAPIALSLTISAAVVSSASLHTSAAITTGKLLIMTTLQKTLIASAIVTVIGAGIYQAKHKSMREEARVRAQNSAAVSAAGSSLEAANHGLRVRPVSARDANARAKSGGGGFTSTETYALLVEKEKRARLTVAQVGPYLKSKGRSAASLLAAFRTTRDTGLLKEALQKYPKEPHVGFEAATQNDATPKERRAALEGFKQGAPENALANYLSALDYFKTGQKTEAVQQLNAAAAKTQFEDYTQERIAADQEVYTLLGYPPGEAQMLAYNFITEAHLNQVRELGDQIVALAAAYGKSGDGVARSTALQMALDLGRRFDDPAAAEAMRWQIIGIRVERAALSAMDPNATVPGTSQLVQDRLQQIAQQKDMLQELTRQADPLWKTLSDDDWSGYHAKMAASGEEVAVRWLVANYGNR